MLFFFISFAALFLSLASNADSVTETDLDTVIVQGTETSNSIIGGYSQFLQNEFYGQYDSLSEFLQQNASVQVRHHGIGNSADLSIRGSNHEQIRFMVDGQLIENAQYGGFDIDQIPLSQIESIEIIKGHHPLAHQQAIGGLIRIKRSSVNGSTNNLSVRAGEFGQKQIASNHSIPFYGNVYLGIDFSEANNNYATNITSPINNHNNRNDAQPLNNNQVESQYAHFNWNSNHTKIGQLEVGLEARKRSKGIPNYFHNSNTNKALYEKSNKNAHIGYEYINSSTTQFNTNVYYQTNNDRYTDLDQGVSLTPQDVKYHHNQVQLKQQIGYQLRQHLLHLNFSYEKQNYEDDHLLTLDEFKCTSIFSNCDIKSNRVATHATLKDLWRINDSLSLSMLAGAGQVQYKAKEAQSGIQSKDSTISLNQWGVSLDKTLFNSINSQLSINKANRIPTLFELYGDLGAMKGSPSLQPEEALNISLDVSSLNSQILSLSLFYRDMINSIIATYNSQGIGSYDNAQSSQVYGVELGSKKRWNKITIKGFATFQNSETQSDIKSFNNRKLPGIYHQSYSLELNYQFNKQHKFRWQNLIDKEIYLDESNLNKASNRKVSHFKYLFTHGHLTTQIAVNNIFDSTYFDKSNHKAAGRNLNVQLTFSY